MGLLGPILVRRDRQPELRELVGSAASSAAAGDLGPVWEMLAPSTRERFAASHRAMLKGVAEYRKHRDDDHRARMVAEALEREYRMPLADLQQTTPEGVWAGRIAASLGPRETAGSFAALQIVSIETDGSRAQVRARLPDGRPQGFHLVREQGKWWFVDFRPGLPLEKAGVPNPTRNTRG